jgi:hypothetical protein
MAEMYSALAAALAPLVDLFLVETMARLSHAVAATAVAAAHGAPSASVAVSATAGTCELPTVWLVAWPLLAAWAVPA